MARVGLSNAPLAHLQAVGIGSGAAAAASATAAIKWITKDAVGVAGRLLVRALHLIMMALFLCRRLTPKVALLTTEAHHRESCRHGACASVQAGGLGPLPIFSTTCGRAGGPA